MADVWSSISWILDVYIAFMVSFVVTTIFFILFVNVLAWLGSKMFVMVWVYRFQQLKMQWKVVTFLTAVGALVVPVFVKVYGITSEEPVFVSKVTDIIPPSLLFYRRYTNITFNVYVLKLHINKLLLYGSMMLFIPLCMLMVFFFLDKQQEVEQQVDHEASPIDLRQRLSIATQVHNFQQREINGLKTELALLNYNLQEAKKAKSKQQPVKKKHVKPPPCPKCYKSANNVAKEKIAEEKRYTELQNRHTELMRRYYKLDSKYNELAKRLRDEQTIPPPSPTLKLGLKGDDALCVVCMVKKRQFILRPCNHYCVCNDCKNSLENECPLCRKRIQKYEKLFVS